MTTTFEPPAATTSLPTQDTLLAELLTAIRRHRRLALALPAVILAATLAYAFLKPRTYTSRTVFMPERLDLGRLGGLAGLASQFGVNLPLGETGLSPLFYAELLSSDQFLAEVAESRLTPEDSAAGRTVMDHLKIKARTPALRRDKAIRALRKKILVTTEEQVGLVRVEATMPTAELAQAASTRVLELVNRFNGERRRTRAKAEREFTEQRFEEARRDVRRVEDALLAFYQQNRDARAPALVSQRERLQRELQLRQQLFTTLSQSVDQARLQELRDTPIVTVVEQPQLPARPDSRRLVQRIALALAIGGLLSAFTTLALARREGRWG